MFINRIFVFFSIINSRTLYKTCISSEEVYCHIHYTDGISPQNEYYVTQHRMSYDRKLSCNQVFSPLAAVLEICTVVITLDGVYFS